MTDAPDLLDHMATLPDEVFALVVAAAAVAVTPLGFADLSCVCRRFDAALVRALCTGAVAGMFGRHLGDDITASFTSATCHIYIYWLRAPPIHELRTVNAQLYTEVCDESVCNIIARRDSTTSVRARAHFAPTASFGAFIARWIGE